MLVAIRSRFVPERLASPRLQAVMRRRLEEMAGIGLAVAAIAILTALVSYNPRDASFNTAAMAAPSNLAGPPGAVVADLLIQGFGLAGLLPPLAMLGWAWRIASHRGLGSPTLRLIALLCALPAGAATLAGIPLLIHFHDISWPGPAGLGGAIGQGLSRVALAAGHDMIGKAGGALLWVLCAALTLALAPLSLALSAGEWRAAGRGAKRAARFSGNTRPASDQGRRVGATMQARQAPRRAGSRWSWLTGLVGGRRTSGASLSRDAGAAQDMMDHASDAASSGPSPFAARAQAGAPMSYGALAIQDPPTARTAEASRKPRAGREPSLRGTPDAVPAPRAALGGYILPPGFGEEQEDVPPLPLRSAAARAAARRAPSVAASQHGQDSTPATSAQAAGPDDQAREAVRAQAGPAHAEPLKREGGLLAIRKLLGVRGEAQGPRTPAPRPLRDQPPMDSWRLPPLTLLQPAPPRASTGPSPESLQANARLLETVLSDYGVQGAIGEIHAGPVVTLYELEPAPGIRSARVIGLADDIARSLCVTAVRIATVPGRNVIGIEVPNAKRETVFFSELLDADAWHNSPSRLCLALGKDISGAPVYADLARMPHLLIAGTTGSGKSVGINSMILSLLYRLSPEECRLILIDPKMLELSVYDGIPHLMAPVVTEPAKAVTALKWTVREMERRYRGMSQLSVRNIGGYNERVAAARANGEVLMRRVQTGFDSETGKPTFEEQPLSLENLPYIVLVIDEMADLMMVAGKEIEATVQRLAQMARAAGIHVIMATQRPSVDVITGTIKANFPTRISFQVISKFDSRTILGEQGSEQLLGQGDMLFMQGGGRITRVHGPFVGDAEVEDVVRHLRQQGEPSYLDEVTSAFEEEPAGASGGSLGGSGNGLGGAGFDGETGLFDQAVALVAREGKASTSFIQRHLSIGYNRAAKLIEQMEKEGIVGPANHVGKREVLVRRESEN